MTNLSSLFKTVSFAIAGIIALAADLLWTLGLGHEGDTAALILRVATLALFAGSLFFLSRMVATLRRIGTVCERVASGNLEARICEVPEPGAVGDLQRRINHMLDIADAFLREASYSAGCVSRGKYYRKVLLRGLPGSFAIAARMLNAATEMTEQKVREFARFADGFEANVGDVVSTVSAAAAEMHEGATTMSRTAAQTGDQAMTVAAATEEASTNVRSVAGATEELSASVAEIGRQVAHSTDIARRAVEKADRTNGMVNNLADAAQKVSDVMQLIQEIASQTNLLALNATIEAARAGEAGKGFAVVAGEVKALASQTARATTEIADQISAIGSATTDAVAAIKDISTTIREMDGIAERIAAAVDQQSAATQEIARNIQQASAGTDAVASNISAVKDAAIETGAAATQLSDAAAQLKGEAAKLQADVTSFMAKARAA